MFEYADPTYGPPVGALMAVAMFFAASVAGALLVGLMCWRGTQTDTPEHRIDEITKGKDDDEG